MMSTLHLFPVIDQHLFQLLRSLTEAQWNTKTLAGSWTVKDVTAHLLDTAMRSVSIYRDNYAGEKPEGINSYETLVGYLNTRNAEWVQAFKQVSPMQLIELLQAASTRQYELFQQLDPAQPALFPVAWAGEETSTNAFHIAREYTEKFHHQLQIREATGSADVLLTQELFFPFLNTLMQGLPFTYRSVDASEGSIIQITVSGEAGGIWQLKKETSGWVLLHTHEENPSAEASIPPSTAWKLFTKGITIEDARQQVQIRGDENLAQHCLQMLAVMALRPANLRPATS